MEMHGTGTHILLCNGRSCTKNGAENITNAVREEICKKELESDVHTTKTLCNGQCQQGAIVIVYPSGHWYGRMTPELGRDLVKSIHNGQLPQKHCLYMYSNNHFQKMKDTLL